MTTVELAKALAESIERDGPLPVIIWENSWTRYKVDSANPCSNRDHFLISTGDPDRS